MTKAANGASGANPDSGGDPGTDPNNSIVDPSNPTPGKDDKVAYATYQKILGEKKKLADKVEAMEAEQKARDEKALKEKEDYKTLAENREKELLETKAKLAKGEERIANGVKLRAILTAVGGEVEREYWELLPTSMVEIDPDTGLPTEQSVANAVKVVQAKYPKIITPANANLPPNTAARGGTEKLSHADWDKLPADKKIERMKDLDMSTV